LHQNILAEHFDLKSTHNFHVVFVLPVSIAMADSQIPPMVLIHANGRGVPISFQVGVDGKCTISALRLHLRFQFLEGSMHVDEEVFDVDSGELLYTIGQESSLNDQGQC